MNDESQSHHRRSMMMTIGAVAPIAALASVTRRTLVVLGGDLHIFFSSKALKGYGAVLRTTLSKEQQAKIEATLQGR